jgi:glycosyltransferase involved in cell wall biosynthesis
VAQVSASFRHGGLLEDVTRCGHPRATAVFASTAVGARWGSRLVRNPLRVLVLAFACAPQRGSEAGSGWGVVQALVHEGADVTAVVSTDHRTARQGCQSAGGSSRLRFVEVPIPPWGERVRSLRVLSRPLWHLSYFAWLRSVVPLTRALIADGDYDVLLHTGYGSYWMPGAGITDQPVPVVFGPVGGGTRTQWPLWPYLGPRGVVDEVGKRVAVRVCSLLPSTRRTWRGAATCVVENAETLRRLPKRLRPATIIANRAVLAEAPRLPTAAREPFVLFPSALVPRKGWRLALHGLAHTPQHVRLVVVNDGSEEQALRRLATKLGITERVQLLGRVPRDEMFQMMARAAAVVFCGLREEGGLTLSEAMLSGSPVVVLGHGGARHIAQQSTDPSRVALVDVASTRGTAERMGAAMTKFAMNPPRTSEPHLDQATTRASIIEALHLACPDGL